MRPLRHPLALPALASVLLPALAHAEGSVQVNVPNDQFAQAASNNSVQGAAFPTNGQRMGQLGLDILAAGERFTWTGDGTLDVWAPGLDPAVATPTTTLNSGQGHTTTAAGEWLLEMNTDQSGAWDSKSAASPARNTTFMTISIPSGPGISWSRSCHRIEITTGW